MVVPDPKSVLESVPEEVLALAQAEWVMAADSGLIRSSPALRRLLWGSNRQPDVRRPESRSKRWAGSAASAEKGSETTLRSKPA